MKVICVWGFLASLLCTVAVFAETDATVKSIDNANLEEMLNAGIPFPVIEKMLKDSNAAKLSAEPTDIIKIKTAAEKGKMPDREQTALLTMVIDIANREKTRIKELINQFMNVCINEEKDKTEYESMMRQILREGRIVVTELRKHIEEENEFKRMGVVDALGKVGDKSPLVVRDVKLMLGDRNGGVREKAAEALARLAPPEVVDELIEIIERRSVPYLDGIAQALGKMGNQKAVKPLAKLLTQTVEPISREAAAQALGELRTKDEQAINALLEAVLDDQDAQLRILAAAALGSIGERRAIGYIIRSFQRHEGKPGRAELLRQLKNFKSLKVVEFLIPCTDKDAPDVRLAAQDTLKILTGSDASNREGWDAVREVIRDRPDWSALDAEPK